MNQHSTPWRTAGPQLDHLDADNAADLRRRRGRELADYIIACAQYAMPDERELLHAVYDQGLTAAQVARLSGSSPRTVRRRVRRLVQRFVDPRFTFVLHHREHWPATRRRVATACILQGRTLRGASRHLRTSLHSVRKEMNAIDALYTAHQDAAHHHATDRTHQRDDQHTRANQTATTTRPQIWNAPNTSQRLGARPRWR